MTHPRYLRRPTLGELGLDVTVAIVALTFDGHVVAVSDRMISFGDVVQAADDAALKSIQVADNWFAAFAGDPSAFRLVARKIVQQTKNMGEVDHLKMRDIASECYASAFTETFAGKHLVQLGYGTVEEFRRSGLQDLGVDSFNKILLELMKFDLELEVVVFGVESNKPLSMPRLFDVVNPGRAVEQVTGYTVVGSGHYMAMAALQRKSLNHPRDLENVIYRLLDAKFSAETASGVGKSTTVIWITPNGGLCRMDEPDIEKIRKVWEETIKKPSPPEALELIKTATILRS